MRLTHFGQVELPGEDTQETLAVSARSALLPLPNGSFDQDGGQLYLQPVRISRKFLVVTADQDIDTRVRGLLKEMGKGRRLLRGVLRDGRTEVQTFAKVVDIQREVSPEFHPVQQPLSITWEMDYPYWLARDDEPVYLDQGYLFDGSWNLTAGRVEQRVITASPHVFTLSNTGGVRVPRGYLLIEPRTGGSLSNFTVSNAANGMQFTYSGSLTDADSLEIEMLTKSVEKNNVGAYASFSTPADQLDWMILELDDNEITITGTVVGTVDLWWQWSRHYL